MLHPFVVIAIGEVFARVCTTGLFAVGGGFGSLHGAGEEVAEFEGLDKVAVPDHAAILGADVLERLIDFMYAVQDVSRYALYIRAVELTSRHLGQAFPAF